MIFDSIENLCKYKGAVPFAEEIAEALSSVDFMNMEKGEFRTAKSGILIQIQEYETVESPAFEVHKKFIDIHYILSGEEYYDAARILSSLPSSFDEEKDIGFFDSTAETRVRLTPGVFALSYPFEPHRPRIRVSKERGNNKKLVIKIPYSEEK